MGERKYYFTSFFCDDPEMVKDIRKKLIKLKDKLFLPYNVFVCTLLYVLILYFEKYNLFRDRFFEEMLIKNYKEYLKKKQEKIKAKYNLAEDIKK